MRGMIHPNPELQNRYSGFSQGLNGPGFWSHAGIYFTLESSARCALNYHGSSINWPAPTRPEHNWCHHEASDFCTPGGGRQSLSSSKANAVSFVILQSKRSELWNRFQWSNDLLSLQKPFYTGWAWHSKGRVTHCLSRGPCEWIWLT